MQEALSLLIDLTPNDVEQLLSIGTEREVHREDTLLVEGERPDALYIVLEGLLEARVGTDEGSVLGSLGPGELLGEIAWLEERPASATVRVVEDSVVLEIPHERAAKLLESDPALSARFYRALGRIVSARLRQRSIELAAERSDSGGPASVRGHGPWQALAPAIDGLKDLVQRADASMQASGGVVADELVAETHAGFDAFCNLLTRELGDAADASERVREEVGALVRREMHPYLKLTRIAERFYTKPRGYAGDFLTIQWMYENDTGGVGAAGMLIDTAFLERPAAKAVRNRRGLLAGEIDAAIARCGKVRGGKVTSLACGPAAELFDVFEEKGPDALEATCLDIDLQALALVSDRRDRSGLKNSMRLEQANLVYLATGRSKLDLAPQDLIYSIGLIDYFQDPFVIALLDWVYDRLSDGGKVVLGNFHPENPDKALMDHVLDWRLIHRDEADMHRLFESSKFGRGCTEIRFEEERVNLFAMCVK